MSDTWEEYRIYVVSEIKAIKNAVKENANDMQDIKLEFSVLNTKILVGAGFISMTVGIAVSVILKFL